VLLSILTTSESLSNLDRMAQGLMDRFHTAGQPAPLVLYTDRDCCSSKFTTMFNLWDNLIIRLDSWHFMRRLASASTNESHPLYGIFMARISTAIFEWDFCDVELLKKAKCGELKLAGIRQPSPETVSNLYLNRSWLDIVDGRLEEWRIRPIFSKNCFHRSLI
jgi:hypothetical protein